MRRSILLLSCLAVLVLAGCGNKGALYLPAKPVTPVPAPSTPVPATTAQAPAASTPAHAASAAPTPASH